MRGISPARPSPAHCRSGRPDEFALVSTLSTSYSNPASDTQMVLSAEQSFPLRGGWLRFSKLRARVDKPLYWGPLSLHLKVGMMHPLLP